jgi:cytochrome c oxidase cbb3-type subunit 3
MTKKNKQKDELRNAGHSFVGIEEYDNDMPRWWLNLFYVTIVFGVGYLAWYHLPFFPSKSLIEEYENARSRISVSAEEIREEQARLAQTFSIAIAVQDPAVVALGNEVYAQNCASCHGSVGQGLVGPNLGDGFWIHGSAASDVLKVVADGVAAKGMPAWEPILGSEKVQAAVVFLKTLEGKTAGAPQAKGPEGEPGVLHD